MGLPFRNLDERLRRMYAGGRGNTTARRYARFWAVCFALGILPRRWVTLEVPGRRSGNLTRFPLGMTRYEGQWYLGAMLGECNWTRNVRANDGYAVLHRSRRRAVRLTEVPVEQRPPILKAFLQQVPGARPHNPVSREAPVEDFEPIAGAYPVFRVRYLTTEESREATPKTPGST